MRKNHKDGYTGFNDPLEEKQRKAAQNRRTHRKPGQAAAAAAQKAAVQKAPDPARKKRKRITKSSMAVYALYFILAALALSTGTLSRYRARTTVQDTAAIARPYNEPKFTFTAEKLYPGYTKTQTFQVSNKNSDDNFVSQVKMNYRVEIKGTTNLPLTLKLKRREGNGTESYMTLEESARDTDTGEKTWTTKTDTVMPLTEKTDTWTIELIWPADGANSDPGYADEVDSFTVTIKAAQSDN